jgi:hypothetical protein
MLSTISVLLLVLYLLCQKYVVFSPLSSTGNNSFENEEYKKSKISKIKSRDKNINRKSKNEDIAIRFFSKYPTSSFREKLDLIGSLLKNKRVRLF